ncbi:hypothetical protein PSET11_01192 [Arthrobacter ulcerisalmonis]|uniref:Flagellar FliJ protein n=1 Tax=Arthrobacter ulcerisalmonis TaxID=2483813 RepID=A0A3P5WRG8_9MICC|nr:flagellar FliJ family protein [Arthrobacter ulcerisalmonis]VDC23722.1 hypothetical protein PSET11_01192 [Arthrobacter ulcerisalmonis]
MSREFSLAGLLRIRRIQQDQAASGVARAASRSRSVRAREAAARQDLKDSPEQVSNAVGLRAIAAARASAQSMLTELDALTVDAEAQLSSARRDFTQARVRSVGLEKLEVRHQADLAASDLKTEQGALDEIASVSWHRREGARS